MKIEYIWLKIINKIRSILIMKMSDIASFITKRYIDILFIEYGKNVRFYGFPKIVKMQDSNILIGNNCTFRSDFSSNLIGVNRRCIIATVREKSNIYIGNNSGFSGTVIGAAESIEIGNNVLCGANTLITDFDWHQIDPHERLNRIGQSKSAPIKIGNNVWLGINVIVLKGVNIGDNTVIGANSLVVNDIPENVVAAGNPCKVIKVIKG